MAVRRGTTGPLASALQSTFGIFEHAPPYRGGGFAGRTASHLSALLKLYIYGHLDLVQSSRRLEREAGRDVE